LPLAPRKQEIRARLSGRAGFAFAAFAATLAALLLLDRIGLSEGAVAALGPIFILGGFGVFSVLARTTRAADFFAARRIAPATYGGLAVAALTGAMLAALAPPSLGPARFAAAAAGVGLGLLGLAIWTGPAMRRVGAYTPVDMLAARFPAPAARGALAASAAAASLLLAIAGLEGAARALETAGASRMAALALAGLGAAVCAAPGGLGGLVWAAAAGAVVALAALLAPGAALLARGVAPPAPGPGDADAWAQAMAALTHWSGGPEANAGVAFVAATALGLMCLAPLMITTSATASARHARRAAHVGLFWTCVIVIVGASALAASALAFRDAVAAQRADRLPDVYYAESAAGHLDICGGRAESPAAARAICAARKTADARAGDARPRDAFLFRTMAANLGMGSATGGLATAAATVVGVILAAAGLLSFATIVAHDLISRARGFANLMSARVAAARGGVILGAVGATAVSARLAPDPALAVAAAIGLSAAFIWPVMALALWPRANSRDALAAIGAAAATASAVVFLLAPGTRDFPGWASAALAAAAFGALAGALSSLTHAPEDRIPRTLNTETDFFADG